MQTEMKDVALLIGMNDEVHMMSSKQEELPTKVQHQMEYRHLSDGLELVRQAVKSMW